MFKRNNDKIFWERLILSFLLILFVFPLYSYSQEISQDQIIEKMKSLKNSNLQEYSEQMKEIGELSSEYIRNKEQECSGEFSSLVFDNSGEKKRVRKKLSKKEKALCLYMLIDFRIKVTRISFDIRKNHLETIHKVQLQELEDIQKKQIQELEKMAQKFR